RTAGGELRLGTTSMYMGALDHNNYTLSSMNMINYMGAYWGSPDGTMHTFPTVYPRIQPLLLLELRIKQVLCDECGGAIRYRPPSFWKKLRAEGVPTLREICLRLRRSLQCHTNRNISRIARRENAPRPMHSCPNHRHRQPWLPVAAPRRRRHPPY